MIRNLRLLQEWKELALVSPLLLSHDRSMRSVFYFFAGVTFSIFASCSTLENKAEDINVTRYRAIDSHVIGRGRVFILTKSWMAKTYPDDSEAAAIRVAENRLRALGYSIASDPKSSDNVLLLKWAIRNGGVSSYQIQDNSVYPTSHIIHAVDAVFYVTNSSGGPGEKLWEAQNFETWGHAMIDPERMVSVLMERFPN